MRRNTAGVWGLAVAVLLGACAGQQHKETTATEFTRRQAAAEAPVRLLSVRVSYTLDATGGFVRKTEQRYRILTLEGVESWSGIGVLWAPWYREKPDISARVIAPDGTVHALDRKTISEAPAYPDAAAVYSDAREVRAPLPSVSVGSIVEQTIIERTKRPFFEGGSVHYLLLQSEVARDKVELRIEVPSNLPLRYEVRGGVAIEKKESSAAGRRILSFTGGPYPALETPPPLLPDDVARWPHVAFATGSSWHELARAYAHRVGPVIDRAKLPDELKRVVKGAQSEREKADRLLSWMHDRVRYVSLAFGESAIIPAAPEETLQRGYGDCKDQSALLVALLSAVGVEAHVALLRTGPGEDVLPSLPALNAFDHAIVVVSAGKEPFWVDPTSPYARAGELPIMDRGRRALVIADSTSDLVTTQVVDRDLDSYQEVRELHLPEYGKGRVVETTTATGALEQQLRSNLSGPDEKLRKTLGEYVEKTYGAKELGKVEYGSPTQVTVPYRVRIEAKSAATVSMGLLGTSIPIVPKIVFNWLPEPVFGDEPRDVDLVLPLPYSASVRYVIRPPEDFLVKPLQKLPDLAMGPVALSRSLRTLSEGTVEAAIVLRTLRQRWTPEDLRAFRAGVRRYESENVAVVELEHRGQRLIDENKLAEGMAVFQAGVRQRPKSAVAQMRLALNLVDAGFGRSARSAAQRAAELAPDDADMQGWLAVVLARDLLGRVNHSGYERDAAVAAYRRAAKLAPDDLNHRIAAAILLEHDVAGRRYAPGAALDQAIQEYETIGAEKLAEHEDGSYSANPAFALMYARRFREARDRVQRIPQRHQPAVVSIVSSTALSGPASGISEVDRLGLRGEQRSEMLASASSVLAQLRRYPEAAALIAAASPGSKQAAAFEGRARHLRKMKAIDLERLPAKSPEQIVKKVFVLGVLGEKVPEDLVARAARETSRSLWQFEEAVYAATGGALPRQVVADTMYALLETTVSGDAQVGYRVEARVDTGEATMPGGNVYLLTEGGKLRVRALENLDEVAEQALQDLQSGNKKRGRTWLQWARAAAPSDSGGDPLATPAWVKLYADGKGDLELAAAALCGSRCGNRSTSILEQARRSEKPGQQTALDLALTSVHSEDPDRVLALARALKKAHPRSAAVLRLELHALARLKRTTELEQRAEEELTRARDDEKPMLYHVLAGAREQAGDLKGGLRAYRSLVDLGRADAQAYNNMAWWSLFTSGANAESLTNALRAAEMTSFNEVRALHTLAVVYAELGKIKEARDTLNRLLTLRRDEAPIEVDYYIIGRLAEHFHLLDEARTAYGRIEKPKEESRVSTYALAQRRLKRL